MVAQLMLFSDFDIAARLRDRGYDGQIAQIFARDACRRGRLRTCRSLAEAVDAVAELLNPRGIAYATTCTPTDLVENRSNRVRPHVSDPSVF